MKVKICGITNVPDAQAAIEAGADALGFIFVEHSPRNITPGSARQIIHCLPPFVTPVGVVMNRSREAVNVLIEQTGIKCIQFHGKEDPEDIQGYSVPVYKAFRVGGAFDVSTLKRYGGNAYLLDAYVEGEPGGTGKVLNWDIALEAKQYGRIILAGGIRPENVVEAVQYVQPYAIDVNSGVESAPGKKDHGKLLELFSALQQV